MVTTIIAIYGAVVATVSTLLGAWYFLYNGPRLQAEANVYPPVEENDDELDDEWFISLRVWNTGRAEVTVNITSIMIHHDDGHNAFSSKARTWRPRSTDQDSWALRRIMGAPPFRYSLHSETAIHVCDVHCYA